MVDDQPCQLPDLSSYRMVIPRLPIQPSSEAVVMAETPTQSDFQPGETDHNGNSEAVARAVKVCLEAGLSESKIVKEVLGYQGARYQFGKARLEALKNS